MGRSLGTRLYFTKVDILVSEMVHIFQFQGWYIYFTKVEILVSGMIHLYFSKVAILVHYWGVRSLRPTYSEEVHIFQPSSEVYIPGEFIWFKI